MALVLADMLPATLATPGLSEAQFLALCRKFPDAMCEYTAGGVFMAMPPNPPDFAALGMRLCMQLYHWAGDSRRALTVGPGCGFLLPNGARRSPYTAWMNRARYEAVKTPVLQFPVFVPEFVIELRTHHSRMPDLREKMEEYIANGVLLA